MPIDCIIASKNMLVMDKVQHFIHKTHFLTIFEGDELSFNEGYSMLLFFDVDSLKIGAQAIKKILSLPLIPIFISSAYTKAFLSEWLGIEPHNIGLLQKNASYKIFIDEVSNVIDNSNKISV